MQCLKLYAKCVCMFVCVCVCLCVEDGVEQLRHVHDEVGEVMAATCLDETREETNRSINTRGWKPSVGPKHTGARHPAPPANKVTDNITSVFLVQEQQQRVVQSSYVFTGRVKASGSNISA